MKELVIKHYHIYKGIKKTRRIRRVTTSVLIIGLLAVGGPLGFKAILNERKLEASNQTSWLTTVSAEVPPVDATIPWPSYGQAAYGVPAQNVYASSKSEAPAVPIASLAKVITALAVLKEKPLEKGEQGPTITFTQADEALFSEYLQKNGVVLPVETGNKVSQYEALQATLLVSANNISDTLVVWAFGSVEEYVEYANEMLQDLGLEKTVVADASGFSPNSVSTPQEMTKLGQLYMEHPILREIALQKTANWPGVGEIENANSFANTDGVVGIKIGYTDEAGRTYMAAKINRQEGVAEKISIAVVLGADNLAIAATDALKVLRAGDATSVPAP